MFAVVQDEVEDVDVLVLLVEGDDGAVEDLVGVDDGMPMPLWLFVAVRFAPDAEKEECTGRHDRRPNRRVVVAGGVGCVDAMDSSSSSSTWHESCDKEPVNECDRFISSG